MLTSMPISPTRRPVRLPFRVLAGLICILGSLAVMGTFYVGWQRGIDTLRAQDVVWLPGFAWFLRLAYSAAVRGTSPTEVLWPFATSRVAQVYFLIVIVLWAGPR